MSFLLREELPHVCGMGSAGPVSNTYLYSDMMIHDQVDEYDFIGTRVHDCTRLYMYMYACGQYALRHVYYWRGFKFGDVLTIRQTAKLKSSANFPAIRSVNM